MRKPLALTIVLASVCAAQDTARMDQIVRSFVTDQQFMGSVLVARDREILFNKGYGFANLEWDIPNSPSTKFRIGSITKQFTAASILLLEQRGKLSVDDLLSKYLPDAPAAWSKITLFNLLTHTSGIPDIEHLPDYPSWEPFPSPVAKTVARFYDRPLEFAPGEKYRYSSSAYIVLGYIIEKLTGNSYEEFLKNNIFIPLGMNDSGYDWNSAIIRHRAAGYGEYCPAGCKDANGNATKERHNANFIHMSIPHAAGSLYSTTEDLWRWEQGLFGGKVLSEASLKKMTTPYKGTYAVGLFMGTQNGRKTISHSGGIEGFSAFLLYYPDDKVTVVVLANGTTGGVGRIANQLGAAEHGETLPPPPNR